MGNILITGGTGSFGQALVSRLLNNNQFNKIIIYSRDEHKQEKMAEWFDDERLRFFIGDVRDKERLQLALLDADITHVVHAAALKIVPSAEYNPFETLKTNVLGTQNLIDCCTYSYLAPAYRKIILLSTDKACSPINLYGATKLCAEKLITAANNIRGPHGPRFSVVRYGNVANSNGSVIKVFQEQISKGLNLTVTHPDMTRFWITLEQSVDHVLKSFEMMYGGEIFVPDMPAFKVSDLALTMMSEYAPEKKWFHVTGIRPGEKLHETIITKEEFDKCDYDPERKIYIINPPINEHIKADQDEIEQLRNKSLTSDAAFVQKLNLESALIEIGVKCV